MFLIQLQQLHMKHPLTLLFFLFTCALYGTDDEEWEKAIEPYKNREKEVVIDLWNKDFTLNQAIRGRVRGIFEALDKNLSLLPPDMRRITRHDSLAIPMVGICLLNLQYLLVELSELHLFSCNNIQAFKVLLNELITSFSLLSLEKTSVLHEEKSVMLSQDILDALSQALKSEESRLILTSHIITAYVVRVILGIQSFTTSAGPFLKVATILNGVWLANRLVQDSIPICHNKPSLAEVEGDSFCLAKWAHKFKWKEAQFGSRPLVFFHENYSSYNRLTFLMLKGVDLNQLQDGCLLDLLVENGSYRMVGLLLKMGAIPTHKTIIEALNRLLNLQEAKKRSGFMIYQRESQMEKNQAHALRLVIQHVMNALIEQERDAIRRGEVPMRHSSTLNYLIRNVDFSDTSALMRLIEDDVNRDVSYYIYLLIWLDTHYPLEDDFANTPVAYTLINYRKALEEIYFNQKYQSKDLLRQQILSRDFLFDTLNLLPSEGKNQALHQAIMRGNLQQVGFWLQLGANLNARNQMGNTALGMAVTRDNVAFAELLIEFGADILPALNQAIKQRRRKMTRYLLQQYVKLKCAQQGSIAFDVLFDAIIQRMQESSIVVAIFRNVMIQERDEDLIDWVREIFYEEGWMVRPSRILSIQPVPLLGPPRTSPPINIHRRNSSDTDRESDFEDDDSYSLRSGPAFILD